MFTQGKALIIGVNEYSSPYITQLAPVKNDIASISEILIDKNYCAYLPDNVNVLAGTQANLTNIYNAFEKLKSSIDSTVLIYFSGHGGRIWTGNRWQIYLCPTETDPDDIEHSALSGDDFSNLLSAIEPQKLIVILDACHAGGAKIKATYKGSGWKAGIPSSFYEPLSKGKGRVLILSSKEDQFSYTRNEQSLFTFYLVKALKGEAAIRGDGYVHILDLFDYVNDMVSKDEINQTPILKADDLDSNFRIAIHNKKHDLVTKSFRTMNEIRERIIIEPLKGAKELSEYLALYKDPNLRDEVDLIFSEMIKTTREGELFGWSNDQRSEFRRCIFKLLKACTELSNE